MKWINIDDEEPQLGELIFVCDLYNKHISLARMMVEVDAKNNRGQKFYIVECEAIHRMPIDFNVTHWSPLPDLPEEE